MRRSPPPFPEGRPTQFRSTVHGTVFAGRDRHLDDLHEGDRLLLLADPPVQDSHEVWVHLASGDPVGHLPPEISSWLGPWLQGGGGASARAIRVKGPQEPSWRRLLLEVSCAAPVPGG